MSDKNQIVLREIEKGDIPAVTSLINSLFLVQKPESYFRWMIFENISPVFAAGAFHDGELIGTFGVQIVTLANGLRCGRASWPSVSVKWQGSGVFSGLVELVTEHCKGKVALLFNFFPQKAKLQIERSLDMKMYRVPNHILASGDQFDNPGVSVSTIDGNTVFRHHCSFTADSFGFGNTREYLLWRYAKNPFYSYDAVSIDTGEYAIVKPFTDPVTGDSYGDIVEVQCHPDDRDKIKRLVLGACWYLKTRGTGNITVWAMPATRLSEVVEEIGFTQDQRVPCYFGIKVLEPQMGHLYDFSKWTLQQGDHLKY